MRFLLPPRLRGLLCAMVAVSWLAGPAPAAVLTGDTSNPEINTFVVGEQITLNFEVKGGKPGEKLGLQVVVSDEQDRKVDEQSAPVQLDGAGHGKASVSAPAKRLGFYRVNASLSDGTQLAALGSRKAGYLTYAIVPSPSGRNPVSEKDAFFGMQGGFGPWGERIYPLLGIHWVLDGAFEWKRNEPDRAGQFQASQAGAPAAEREWKTFPLPTLFAAPAWAVKPETAAYMTGTLTPAGESAWDAYCRKAVAAFSAKYPELGERIYQITWEPVQPWGFKGTDEELIRIYEIAYRAIHESDPKAVVAGPTRGLDKNEVEHTTRLFQLGLGKYVDAFSIHPYFSLAPENDGLVRQIRRLRDGISRYANKELPFLGTEQGFSTHENANEELEHARGLMRQNLIMFGEGFRSNMLFYIVDYRMGEQHGYGYYYTLVDGVPWGPAKIAPKPIAPALAAQSYLLEGHKSAGAIEWLGDTIWGYAFEREGKVTLALWDFGGKPRRVTLPVGVEKVRVFDWMGNERKEVAASGNLALELTPEPIYVQGVSPQIWSKNAEKFVRVETATLRVYPGGKAALRGTIKNVTSQPFQGKLAATVDDRLGVAIPQKEVALEPGASQPLEIPLAIPASAAPASYAIKLALEQNGTIVGLGGSTLELTSPAAITKVRPIVFPNGKSGVEVTLKDEEGHGLRGTLTTRLAGINGSEQTTEVEIPSGSSKEIAIANAVEVQPWLVYQFQSAFRIANGSEVTNNSGINFLGAKRLTAPPRIDGALMDWPSSLAPIRLTRQHLIRSPQYYSGEADLNAYVGWAWDAQSLYLGVKVTDDQYFQSWSDVNTWRGDCLQIGINLDPLRVEQTTGNLLADVANKRRFSELAVALTDHGPEVYRHLSFDAEKLPLAAVGASKIRASIRRESGSITYEIAIPWSELGADGPPQPTDLIGIALTINDADSAEQKDPSAIGLFGGIAPQKDTDKFGLLLLE